MDVLRNLLTNIIFLTIKGIDPIHGLEGAALIL